MERGPYLAGRLSVRRSVRGGDDYDMTGLLVSCCVVVVIVAIIIIITISFSYIIRNYY